MARKIFHGSCGEIRKRYREDQEDQPATLGLVLNAAVLWNARYVDAALKALPSTGISRQRRGRCQVVTVDRRLPQRVPPVHLHPTHRRRTAAASRPGRAGERSISPTEPHFRPGGSKRLRPWPAQVQGSTWPAEASCANPMAGIHPLSRSTRPATAPAILPSREAGSHQAGGSRPNPASGRRITTRGHRSRPRAASARRTARTSAPCSLAGTTRKPNR